MFYQRKTKGKPESKEQLRELYKEVVYGISNYKQIGERLGVSDNAVRKWFKTEGRELPKKNLPQIEFECSHCGKKFMREHNRSKDSRHGFYYCDRHCKDAGYKKQYDVVHGNIKK